MTKRIVPFVLAVAMASSISSAFAADPRVVVVPPPAPEPVPPVVEIITLPFTVAGAIVNALIPPPPPPPAPVVAKY